jgi:hypothetical protein
LEFAPPETGRKHKDRQKNDRADGDAPGEYEHRTQNQKDRDEIANDVGEYVGERCPRALNVGIKTADKSSGLGAGEECQWHLLDMLEQTIAKREDNLRTDL